MELVDQPAFPQLVAPSHDLRIAVVLYEPLDPSGLLAEEEDEHRDARAARRLVFKLRDAALLAVRHGATPPGDEEHREIATRDLPLAVYVRRVPSPVRRPVFHRVDVDAGFAQRLDNEPPMLSEILLR
jgi:hypothetical protein